jgi:L-threonylcarbamoyladenylate synthase
MDAIMSREELGPDLSAAEASLRSGGVVLAATDTVYGLAVAPGRPDSVRALYALKGRDPNRPLPIMVGTVADVGSLGVDVNPAARRLLDSDLVPGALTLALGFADGAERPAWLDGRVEVAVRIPAASPMATLVQRLGPLLVTSANHTNRPTPSTVAEILDQLDGRPDAVVDSGAMPEVPSSLVNCNLDVPVVERAGVVPVAVIEEVLR